MEDESEQPEAEEGSEEVKEEPKPETLINTEEDFDKFVRHLAWNQKVLNLGCGNSILPEEMFDQDGYR